MTMGKGLRKLALTTHIISSVGWLGAVLAYICLVAFTFSSHRAHLGPSIYLVMELLVRSVIVPMSLASLATGIVQSLGTSWGLFRHYWVVAKLSLTLIGTLILLKHMESVSAVAKLAAASAPDIQIESQRPHLMVHAVGGLVLLMVVTAISVFKPWGMTPYGRRKSSGG